MKISQGVSDRARSAGVGVLVGVLLGGVVVLVARLGTGDERSSAVVPAEEVVVFEGGDLLEELEETLRVPEGVSDEALVARESCVTREMERRVPSSDRTGVIPGAEMPEWLQRELLASLEACPVDR